MHGIQQQYLYKSAGNNGDDSGKYSIQRGYSAISTSERKTAGNNKLRYQPGGKTARTTAIFDTQCKICDMAGNVYEWTTETSSNTSFPCVTRGGHYDDTTVYAANRSGSITANSRSNLGFRPLLYLQHQILLAINQNKLVFIWNRILKQVGERKVTFSM